MLKKVLIVATIGSFLNFERNDIKILHSLGYEVHCASNFNLSDLNDSHANGITQHQVNFAHSPFACSNLTAYRQLKELFCEIEFELVYCHTPMGGVLGR